MKAKKPLLFRVVKSIIKFFYPTKHQVNLENLPDEPCIIVSNHSKTNGPITFEIFSPYEKGIWCIGEMMNIKEVPKYAFNDFWSKKPKAIRWLYKILSYIIAPIASYVFTNADAIPVYKDSRIITTFKETVKCLEDNKNIVIFPEHAEKYNHIINDFQDKFIDVARLYYKKTKKEVTFVPCYLAVKLNKVVYGKGIKFDANDDINNQRKIIKEYLMNEITNMALELPRHKVVVYDNIGKKKQPYSK